MLAKPVIAIVFGAFMLCAETCLHADSWLHVRTQWPDLPLHDWAAGGFLFIAGIASQRDWSGRWPYQATAWGFMLSLLIGALFGHFADWLSPPDTVDWFSEGTFVILIAALTVVAFGATLATLSRRSS